MIDSHLLPRTDGYIDGQWVEADSGKRLDVTNPATGEVIAQVPRMSAAETQRAIEAATRSLATPLRLEDRRRVLERIVTALQEHRSEIGRILTQEHGKPLAEAEAEVDYAAGFFRYCAANIDALQPRILDEKPRGLSWRVFYRPAGVVGLITPWNFPIGMIAKKLSAAIAADCASVIKPSSKTPLTMIALFRVLEDVGLPQGRVNLVMGPAGPISDCLCEHPAVRCVSFTGSTEVGRQLMEKCAPGLKRVTLELGGNAPFIVFADANLDHAADQLLANKFRGSGQTCVCANRILVHQDVADAFTEKIAERVARLSVGNGMEAGVDIGPLIDAKGFNKVRRHAEDALQQGARLVVGEIPDAAESDWGCFYPPTVIDGVRRDAIVGCEETFGPLVAITRFSSDDEALEMANDTEFGLAAYLFTADEARAERAIRSLHFAHVGHNTGSGPAPEAPFGGMLQSGFGREGGIEGLFEFVEPQTVPRG